MKRAIDIIVSLLGLILLSPVYICLARAIKRDSPGPVFYRGLRAARLAPESFKGNPCEPVLSSLKYPRDLSPINTFCILKFRTMYECPESYTGAKVTAQGDPRITPIGKWLRDTKLNEFPQLWNVLKGEMSLVGPRPEDPDIAATWPEEVRREVLSVRPGMTSPASVIYRNEESLLTSGKVMDIYLETILPSKLRLDQLYVRHCSFWLDLDVLFWTLLILIRANKKEPPEEHLFLGPITRVARHYLNWFVIDSIITFASFGLVGLAWRAVTPLNAGWSKALGMALAFALIFSLTGALFGVNRIHWSKALAEDSLDLVLPVLFAAFAAWGLNRALDVFPVGVVRMGSLAAFVGFLVARYRSRLITGLLSRLLRVRNGAKAAREQVLIVGGGDAGQFAAWTLTNNLRANAFYVVGFVDDDLFKQGARIGGVHVLGRRADIPRLVKEHDVGMIVFAIHNISLTERRELISVCNQTEAQVVILPDFVGTMKIMMDNGREAHDPSQVAELRITLPPDGSVIAIQDLSEWVDSLSRAAQHGDLQGVQAQIQDLQEELLQKQPYRPAGHRE
ncbi:MAG: sugar transferase [Anaerolineales bacterium]